MFLPTLTLIMDDNGGRLLWRTFSADGSIRTWPYEEWKSHTALARAKI